MIPLLRYTLLIIPASLAVSCSCTRKSASSESREFYSGIFLVNDSGDASFTDCATRIRMDFDSGGQYETLRREYDLSETPDGQPVRIEFFGTMTKNEPVGMRFTATPDAARAPIVEVEVRLDSLISISTDANCLSNYTVTGLYRKVHEGEAEILRLRSDYSYSIENFTDDEPLEQGRWYRTSEMTIELAASGEVTRTPFQIVPTQESLAGTGGGKPVIYKKEWL